MNGGKGAQQAGTTTSTQTLPPWMMPYVGTAMGQAGNLLQQGGPNFYPDSTVAGFNPVQEQAFGNIQGLAGSNPFGAATRFNNNLLKGNFSGPEAQLEAMGQGGATNPYLDAMFEQAAGATQNQLSSEFAGSGRNTTAAMPLRDEQLNNLATSMYGGAYDADQSRALAANQELAGLQQGAVGNAQNLVGARLGLNSALAGVGSQVQDQSQKLMDASQAAYNYNQQQPYKNLGQFESFLTAFNPGSQTSSPYFTNPTASLLSNGLAAEQLYNGYNGGSKGGKGGSTTPASSTPYIPTTGYDDSYFTSQQLPSL